MFYPCPGRCDTPSRKAVFINCLTNILVYCVWQYISCTNFVDSPQTYSSVGFDELKKWNVTVNCSVFVFDVFFLKMFINVSQSKYFCIYIVFFVRTVWHSGAKAWDTSAIEPCCLKRNRLQYLTSFFMFAMLFFFSECFQTVHVRLLERVLSSVVLQRHVSSQT